MKTLFTSLFFCFFSFVISAQNQTPNITTATAGKLTVNFTVPTPGAKTYYAVYITNSSNVLINTLSYQYGSAYSSQLTIFWSRIGSTFNPNNTANLKHVGIDGTTGATLSASAASSTKTVYWGNSTTMASTVASLPDGDYKINFELVKENNNRTYTSATFTKGPTAVTPTVSPAISTFSGISIQWTPTNTALTDVKLSSLYSIYPNPSASNVYVNGPDVKSIDVFTLEGKHVFSSNEQKLNISSLKKGTYLLNINTGKGLVSKKLIKN